VIAMNMGRILAISTPSRCVNAARGLQIAWLGSWTLLYLTCSLATFVLCTRMSQMTGMSMPGGWTMSMMWMPMPGQTWLDVTASFLGMWAVMMMAMMLPSLMPVISRYKSRAIPIAAAYFSVWVGAGMAAWCIGIIVTTIAMQLPEIAEAVPLASGVIVVSAGLAQFSSWRTHHLKCCRAADSCEEVLASANSPWRAGLRLGVHCVCCCANLTALLLVLGMMDLRAMTAVTIAITLERLAPLRWQPHRVTGFAITACGLSMVATALTTTIDISPLTAM
jgi:predicted metal-binding membrane protein